MKKYFLILMAVGMLGGCSSEVDKCVDAEMKSWKSYNERIEADVAAGRKKYVDSKQDAYAAFDKSLVEKDERSKAEVEANARRRCMSLQNKK